MCCAASARPRTVASVRDASLTALLDIAADCDTWRPISSAAAARLSTAEATVWTLVVVSLRTLTASCAPLRLLPAAAVSRPEVSCIARVASATLSTTDFTVASNRSAISSVMRRRSACACSCRRSLSVLSSASRWLVAAMPSSVVWLAPNSRVRYCVTQISTPAAVMKRRRRPGRHDHPPVAKGGQRRVDGEVIHVHVRLQLARGEPDHQRYDRDEREADHMARQRTLLVMEPSRCRHADGDPAHEQRRRPVGAVEDADGREQRKMQP